MDERGMMRQAEQYNPVMRQYNPVMRQAEQHNPVMAGGAVQPCDGRKSSTNL